MSNLLPPQEIQRVKGLYKKRLVVVSLHTIAVLAIIALAALVPSYIYSKQQETILLAKKAQFEQKETGELKQSLVATIADINTRLGSFNGSSAVSPVVASAIDPILNARNSSVYLTGLTYTSVPDSGTAQVDVAGVATSRESILAFADSLRKAPGVTAVDVPITNFIKESNLPFGITLTVSLH